MERHYGMDWLRCGAFALLILYHVGMVFVPWDYHVKTAQPHEWVAVPMLFTNAWRLLLLFVISGFASRALLARSNRAGPFLRNRSTRLLLPLVFAVALIVPPQAWVELSAKHGYDQPYVLFLARDYFRFDMLEGIILPTWNHMWFVVYLWVYTLLLSLLLPLVPARAGAQNLFDRAFGGARALWLPILYLLLFQVLIFRRGEETHDLLRDGIAHLAYLPGFLFGFALAGSSAVLTSLARRWPAAAALAIGGYAVVGTVEIVWPGDTPAPAAIGTLFRVAREIQTWAGVAALIGLATRFANRTHRWLPTLTEAVFPFYIIHQTIIVCVEYALLPAQLPASAEFCILVAATISGCWLFYLAGRGSRWIRPWIGLRPLPQR